MEREVKERDVTKEKRSERRNVTGFEGEKKRGHEARNVGGLQKLERARKWTLP